MHSPESADLPIPLYAVATRGARTGGNCPDSVAVFKASNTYRAWHQAPPMVWDPQLAAAAQAYADKLTGEGCNLTHGSTGENLFKVEKTPIVNWCRTGSCSWGAAPKCAGACTRRDVGNRREPHGERERDGP
jgi:uncharacterized protein YkwD